MVTPRGWIVIDCIYGLSLADLIFCNFAVKTRWISRSFWCCFWKASKLICNFKFQVQKHLKNAFEAVSDDLASGEGPVADGGGDQADFGSADVKYFLTGLFADSVERTVTVEYSAESLSIESSVDEKSAAAADDSPEGVVSSDEPSSADDESVAVEDSPDKTKPCWPAERPVTTSLQNQYTEASPGIPRRAARRPFPRVEDQALAILYTGF